MRTFLLTTGLSLLATVSACTDTAGELKDPPVLRVTSPQRSKIMPDVPTVAESGLPGYSAEVWFGVFAPANTPRPVVDRLHQEISRALGDEEIRTKLNSFGTEVSGIGPEPFARYVKEEVTKWSDIVRRADVKPN